MVPVFPNNTRYSQPFLLCDVCDCRFWYGCTMVTDRAVKAEDKFTFDFIKKKIYSVSCVVSVLADNLNSLYISEKGSDPRGVRITLLFTRRVTVLGYESCDWVWRSSIYKIKCFFLSFASLQFCFWTIPISFRAVVSKLAGISEKNYLYYFARLCQNVKYMSYVKTENGGPMARDIHWNI